MFIQFYTDYENLREEIELLYTSSDFAGLSPKIQALLPNNKCDKSLFSNVYDKNNDRYVKIENNLFNSFCDVMEVDYESLTVEIYNLLDKFKDYNNIEQKEQLELKLFNLFSDKNPILPEFQTIVDIIKRREDLLKNKKKIYSLLENYIPIQKYVKKYIEDKYFRSPDVFLKYINTVLTCKLPIKSFDMKFYDNAFKNDSRINLPDDDLDLTAFIADNFFKNIKEYVIDNKPSYACKSVKDVCIASLYEICINNYSIKKCENCGKYFVPYNRSDAIYCDRTSPQDVNKTCKAAAKYSKQLARERSNEAGKIYKSIYNMKLNKINTAKNEELGRKYNQELHFSFIPDAACWRADVKAGKKTEAEYIDWLNSFKKRGATNGKHNKKGE